MYKHRKVRNMRSATSTSLKTVGLLGSLHNGVEKMRLTLLPFLILTMSSMVAQADGEFFQVGPFQD